MVFDLNGKVIDGLMAMCVIAMPLAFAASEATHKARWVVLSVSWYVLMAIVCVGFAGGAA